MLAEALPLFGEPANGPEDEVADERDEGEQVGGEGLNIFFRDEGSAGHGIPVEEGPNGSQENGNDGVLFKVRSVEKEMVVVIRGLNYEGNEDNNEDSGDEVEFAFPDVLEVGAGDSHGKGAEDGFGYTGDDGGKPTGTERQQ